VWLLGAQSLLVGLLCEQQNADSEADAATESASGFEILSPPTEPATCAQTLQQEPQQVLKSPMTQLTSWGI